MIELDFRFSIQSNIKKLKPYKDDWALYLISFLEEWENNEDYILLETSGTTGLPKKIKAKKDWVIFSALNTLKYFNLKIGDTALLALSVKFIAGKMMTIRAIKGKLKLLVVSPNYLSILKEEINIDFCPLVPIQVEKNIHQLHKIKHVLIGGGTISNTLENRLKAVKTNFYHSFAMTETYSHFAIRNISNNDLDFIVFDDITYGINDEACLWIKAPNLGIEFIQTNDKVELTENGFIWKSREDFIINSGGIKFNPEVLESQCQFLTHQNIRFIFSSLPDQILENKIVLAIEHNSIPKGFSKLKKIDFTIDKYGIPKQVYILNSFPVTEHSKKIKRLDKSTLFSSSNIISIYDIE